MIAGGLGAVEALVIPPAPLPSRVLSERVVLVGASISNLWNIAVRYPSIEVRTLYSFDKSPLIDELLGERPPPSAVIIKQCAAYFPLPLEEKTSMVEEWIDRLTEAGISVALATVVPVTVTHDQRAPGRFTSLLQYNDWVRTLTEARGLGRLDLEQVVRRSDDDRHLDEQWATRDGLHLRRVAYRRRLDPIVQPLILDLIG